MLLASRSGNKIPYDSVWVSSRINSTEPVQLDVLVDAGFLELNQPLQQLGHDASKMQAKRLSRGEERREEGETEKKDGATAPIINLFPKPEAPASQEKSYFDRSVEILGPKGRGLAAKLLQSKKKVIAEARAAIEVASTKSDPAEYIGGVIRRGGAETSTWVHGDDFG